MSYLERVVIDDRVTAEVDKRCHSLQSCLFWHKLK